MQLHQALKQKNRLAGEISRTQAILSRENSRRNDNPSNIDCAATWDRIQHLSQELAKLKTAIAVANAPLYGIIHDMAELKRRIAYLAMLTTREGQELAFTGNNETITYTWTAFLNQAAIDKETATLQQRIDSLQDECDRFNATTNISV